MTAAAAVLADARARLAAGDVDGAGAACSALIESGSPQDAAAAHLVLAACAQRRGDTAGADAHVARALERDEGNPVAHYAAAEIAERRGDPGACRASLEHAVALQPGFAAAHMRLGIVYADAGDPQRAAVAFAHAIESEPRSARAYNNLGGALRDLGRIDEARIAFERAVALAPDYDLAIVNLATVWRDAGDAPRAEQLLSSALARPSTGAVRRQQEMLLAGILRDRGALDEAAALYEAAIAAAPSPAGIEWLALAQIYAERDEIDRSRDAGRRGYAANPRNLRGALASRLALPMIYHDAAALEAARASYAEGLGDLRADTSRLAAPLSEAEALDSLCWTNFLLAYQGRDDVELQASYAAFVAEVVDRAAPEWRRAAATRTDPRGKLRVGFVSGLFRDSTVGRYFRSWITDLPRDCFDVRVYSLYPGTDWLTAELRARTDRFADFVGRRARPSIVATAIRADALDVLVYPELGMDHVAFVLAALRLAPRQLAGWGHPVTSGHATIDGYLTCEAMEPADAERHYTERLLRLPGIGTRYRSPALPERVPRASLGLPDGRTLLLCPQSLFKILPDNDALFARILADNPDATLVQFVGRHPRITERYRQRLEHVLDGFGIASPGRVIMLPQCGHDDYLRINLACDVMLDTLHWSGGNTSLDALACGLPVVTLPATLMRGRQSAAMLRLAGVPELIASDADDYVGIASRLVRDRTWREGVAARIRAGRSLVFDRPEPTEAFARLLEGIPED